MSIAADAHRGGHTCDRQQSIKFRQRRSRNTQKPTDAYDHENHQTGDDRAQNAPNSRARPRSFRRIDGVCPHDEIPIVGLGEWNDKRKSGCAVGCWSWANASGIGGLGCVPHIANDRVLVETCQRPTASDQPPFFRYDL